MPTKENAILKNPTVVVFSIQDALDGEYSSYIWLNFLDQVDLVLDLVDLRYAREILFHFRQYGLAREGFVAVCDQVHELHPPQVDRRGKLPTPALVRCIIVGIKGTQRGSIP